ncbi:hypothetical protein B0H63DRAFT_531632 [Podospora didyma]|uniref:Uncharacterized protein n=1 Tax=Podospora didyma TaxID=330526 RepID=A0AAE0P5N2_9PEZI|nr:hypothetical protein B0H63DRAFT_531632 [Podospora didyma]
MQKKNPSPVNWPESKSLSHTHYQCQKARRSADWLTGRWSAKAKATPRLVINSSTPRLLRQERHGDVPGLAASIWHRRVQKLQIQAKPVCDRLCKRTEDNERVLGRSLGRRRLECVRWKLGTPFGGRRGRMLLLIGPDGCQIDMDARSLLKASHSLSPAHPSGPPPPVSYLTCFALPSTPACEARRLQLPTRRERIRSFTRQWRLPVDNQSINDDGGNNDEDDDPLVLAPATTSDSEGTSEQFTQAATLRLLCGNSQSDKGQQRLARSTG